jgi:hypothetical protein
MCIFGTPTQKLPPTPPAPPTLTDPEVQNARSSAQAGLRDTGLGATTLNIDLGGTGGGNKKLAGTK